MPDLSWPEVRNRAIAFARKWEGEAREAEGKQTFWNEFFGVFGRERRTVAAFEVAVKNLKGDYNFIDLLWRGVLLVEHKSFGKRFSAAESQAFAYIEDLAREGRFDEVPRYVVLSDFARFALYDLEPDPDSGVQEFAGRSYSVLNFPLSELPNFVRAFAFIKGEQAIRVDPQDPANEKAYGRMCQLHDELEAAGFRGTDLERLLVRILFCLFAEDTEVFDLATFETFIREQTKSDGSDLGARLNELFSLLDIPQEQWTPSARETFAGFRYINGDLFRGSLRFPPFTSSTRNALLAACEFQWAKVSPAVFGSLFQGILDDKERRQHGAHYTSEPDILKVVNSLFLDDLRTEFDGIRADRSTRRSARLEEFHSKLRSLQFLDPACGCGNFLVLSYRELRQLELELLQAIYPSRQQVFDIAHLVRVDVDQFFGIEYAEWPARIAEVAMWLMDHQMNKRVSDAFGRTVERLPLRTSPHIVQGNALRVDWKEVLPARDGTFILGNPPFIGKQFRNAEQQADMTSVWRGVQGAGVLDYVTCWYLKAANYIAGKSIKVAFVSTNSISQGEQVGILWGKLFEQKDLKILFAHRTFPWESEARGAAHVHVVIVGFGKDTGIPRRIFDYDHSGETATVSVAPNISPYLIAGSDLVVQKRATTLCGQRELRFGSMPNDGGNLLLSDDDRNELLLREPTAEKFIKPLLGSAEFINGIPRWCLWLKHAGADELREMPLVMQRIENVRQHRSSSTREATRALAAYPFAFGEDRQPTEPYLLVPGVSSENRRYVPMGFMPVDVIANNLVYTIEAADLWEFGILTSCMHMAWMRTVCGRLKSDYRYSNQLVYNNFPWPIDADDRRRASVLIAAQLVLDARNSFLPPEGNSSFADLYDPLAMPTSLAKAHTQLDRAVDRCYRTQVFASDRERVEHLFERYERLVDPLLPATGKKKGGKKPKPSSVDDSVEIEEVDDSSQKSLLPQWYIEAFKPQTSPENRGEMVQEGLDVVFERLGTLLAEEQYDECDAFLAAVASEPESSSISALVGILTMTRASANSLPNRSQLRAVVQQRIAATGKNAEKTLSGL